jgi:hypothetical protein
MSDEAKSSQQRTRSDGSREDVLSGTLEDLVAKANSRAIAGKERPGAFTSPAAGLCPDTGDWIELAAGDVASEKKDALLAHAALCSGCLAQLRKAQLALSSEVSAEESAELKQFASTSPQWQHRLAVELAQTPRETKHSHFFPSFVWLGPSLAAALVLALSVVVWWRRENAPERLLAEAYTDARTFDLRVPGAGFAPVAPPTHLRGGGAAEREPAPLLNARAQIERNLERTPSDPHWLQLEARAEMLEEHYDGAIDILDRLVAAGPVTASLLLDDGSAYFMRGAATGSENDRATALDDLRRADELAPADPVILFNEALMMEDRGQVMNAVETWNRYLKVERDPKWQEEGRRHLSALQEKVNQLKTHESRMEQRLATPQSMRALAANPETLAGIDEEFSTSLLPRLLDAAFPLPVDRSRGSPCGDNCLAARSLLDALAASLEHNHQDPWLKEFLPSRSSPIPNEYFSAAYALGQAIDADNTGSDYAAAETAALASRDLFRKLGNSAGADRAEVERIYAEQRSFTFARCQLDAETLLARQNRFAWIKAQATSLAAGCDVSPGAASIDNPRFREAFRLAQASHYLLLELRARNGLADWALESGDNEDAWRLLLDAIHCFYGGDFSPFRVGTFMDGLVLVEDATPKVHLSLLLNREAVALFEIAQSPVFLANARSHLIRAELRAGALRDAQEQMRVAEKELPPLQDRRARRGFQAENGLGLADLYLDRGDLTAAARQLDQVGGYLNGADNPFQLRAYAAEKGELELALGHPDKAETILRNAILAEEFRARDAGPRNIVFARQNRDLYAALAGVWLAEAKPGDEVLALWERYRLRILGEEVPACAGQALDCLKTKLDGALAQLGEDRLMGQIILRDRVLLYHGSAHGVVWSHIPIGKDDSLAAAASLEHVASSPATSQASIDQAARRTADILLRGLIAPSSAAGRLLLEPDPILGNVPWATAETDSGPIGLQFNLEEAPSLLLNRRSDTKSSTSAGKPLVVGASIGWGESQLLPEALHEATAVAEIDRDANLLVAQQATEAQVTARLSTALVIHFAGHAAEQDGVTRLLLAPTGTQGDKPYLDSAAFRRHPPAAARLAVFSACSTGKREEGWDHGMGDIVDTLASIGVPEVVATRWRIDSASAVPMMDAFYRGLASGMNVPQALTAARLSLVRDARYRHPYYWAAYYVSGVGNSDLSEVFHGSR